MAVEYCIGQDSEGSHALLALVPLYAIRRVAKFLDIRGPATTALNYVK